MVKNYTPRKKVFESYYSRYVAGCFCQGDVVTFDKSKMFASEGFKHLQPDLKQALTDMVEAQVNGDAVIGVANVSINTLTAQDQYEPSTLTLAYCLGGGRWYNQITIPGSLAEFISVVKNGVNQVSTIPANAKRNFDEKNGTSIKELDDKEIAKAFSKGFVDTTYNPIGK